MLKAYKYRVYPTSEQQIMLAKHFGCCRWVYNYALSKKIEAYKADKASLSRFTLQSELPILKKQIGTEWLSEVNSNTLQTALLNLDNAYRRFFKEKKGFPRFKNKHSKQSFLCPIEQRIKKSCINWEKGLLSICKIPNIPIVLSRKFEGKIRSITISKSATGKYFASVLVLNDATIPAKPTITKSIGIDLGLKDFLTTSEGDKVANPKYLRKGLDRLKVLQYRASKKKKGSANRKKANLKVAKAYEYITNQRLDFQHKLSYKLTHESQVDTICMETLRVKNMVKNHNLALSISDAGWGKFVELMKYKADWYGKNLILIDTFAPSSKTCSNCGQINKELELKDRIWQCSKCLVTHDRDINAAINIRFMGLSGGASSGVPVELRTIVRTKKQESKCDTPTS